MKRIVYLLLVVGIFGCNSEKGDTQEGVEGSENVEATAEDMAASGFFGEKIDEEGAVSVEELISKVEDSGEVSLKFKGKIDEVCQKKGCWMDIDAGDAGYVTVRFKDYGFFVPKDAAGKEAILEGVAFLDTISVEELKHYAQDSNEPDSVIEAITEPEITYGFTANGVIIK